MKSIVILLLSLMSIQAFAQNPTTMSTDIKPAVEPRSKIMAISIAPLHMAFYGFAARMDVFVSNRVSIGLEAILENNRSKTTTSTDLNITNYSYRQSYTEVNLGATVMLTGRIDKHGLYVNPSIGYMKAKITDFNDLNSSSTTTYSGETAAALQARATIGYQWTWGLFRLAAGAGYRAAGETEIIVRNSTGTVLQRSSFANNGAVLDFHTGLSF